MEGECGEGRSVAGCTQGSGQGSGLLLETSEADDPASITTPVPSMVLREPATGDGMGPPIMAPSKVNVPGATGEAEDSGWRDYYYFDHNGGDGERNQTALDSVQMAEVVEASVQLVTETGDFTESDERKLAAALAAVAGMINSCHPHAPGARAWGRGVINAPSPFMLDAWRGAFSQRICGKLIPAAS